MTVSVSTLLLLGAIAAAPDVVGADAPLATKTFVSERGDPESEGDTTATCRVYTSFAVVVFDAPLTKGIERVEVRDRAPGQTAKAVCANDLPGPKRTLTVGTQRESGYFLAVKGPFVLMRGDDGFGAHDRLAIYRASDGALLLDTERFADRPVRAATRTADTVVLSLRQALKVTCDPRAMPVAACVTQLKRDNGIPDDVVMALDVPRACQRVPAEARLQLGVDAEITLDAAGAKVRFVGGDVVCTDEP